MGSRRCEYIRPPLQKAAVLVNSLWCRCLAVLFTGCALVLYQRRKAAFCGYSIKRCAGKLCCAGRDDFENNLCDSAAHVPTRVTPVPPEMRFGGRVRHEKLASYRSWLFHTGSRLTLASLLPS